MRFLNPTRLLAISATVFIGFQVQAVPVLGCAIPGASTDYTVECASTGINTLVTVSSSRSVLGDNAYALFRDPNMSLDGSQSDFTLDYNLQYSDLGQDNLFAMDYSAAAAGSLELLELGNPSVRAGNSYANTTGTGYSSYVGAIANSVTEYGSARSRGGANTASGAGDYTPYSNFGNNSVDGSSGQNGIFTELILLSLDGSNASGFLATDSNGRRSMTPAFIKYSAPGSDYGTSGYLPAYIPDYAPDYTDNDFGDVVAVVNPDSLPSGGGLPGLTIDPTTNLNIVAQVTEPKTITMLLMGLLALGYARRKAHQRA